ncbi:MAG: alpha/beta hydrolase fold domain-containing protein [Alphaproteobacteria bacterium]|nr:alpha/beta hydrolase fold domain-containing protein [Alphaproteobacteria bacterium]
MEATARARKAEPLPVARVGERPIPGPGGDIRLRLYWPDAPAPVPAIAYFHGGGHVIGSLDTHDLVARNLCAGVGAVVASVDYRMGPEHKFPAPVDDSFAALKWLHANAGSLGAARTGLAYMATAPAPTSLPLWRCWRAMPGDRNCGCNRSSIRSATTPCPAPATRNMGKAMAF